MHVNRYFIFKTGSGALNIILVDVVVMQNQLADFHRGQLLFRPHLVGNDLVEWPEIDRQGRTMAPVSPAVDAP